MKLEVLVNNRIFYSLLIFIILLSTILNYNANVMGPMNVLYEEFILFFKSGFDYNYIFKYSNYTFPMWGFGLVLYIFPSKIYIILFQQIVTFLTVCYFDKIIRQNNLLTNIYKFRLGLLLSFTLYFFHSSVYPYSLGSNLLILGILFLVNFYFNESKSDLIFSSIFLGLMLNLRSDYYFFIYPLFLLLIIYSYIKYNKRIFLMSIIWIIIIQSLLIPWRLYTFNRTGESISVSTNSGHVFFISLGQLPNNKWGITEEDDDPVMYSYLKREFPQENVYSLSFKENKYLQKKFLELVINDPFEFVKKCGYNTYRLVRTPLYTGNLETFFRDKSIDKKLVKNKIKFYLNNFNFIDLLNYVFFQEGKSFIISGIINTLSVVFFLLFLIQFFRFYVKVIFRFNFFNYLLFLIFLYQISLSVFSFHMPIYNMNIYLFYLFGLFYFTDNLKKNRQL